MRNAQIFSSFCSDEDAIAVRSKRASYSVNAATPPFKLRGIPRRISKLTVLMGNLFVRARTAISLFGTPIRMRSSISSAIASASLYSLAG